ncbi:MAG: CxxxxCH/CxxCH domain-containing protein [Geobacteraceae bacterium]|nr:CxxxxCH/CxxCH domain-containing protein [Geobacteraceae bacterium]
MHFYDNVHVKYVFWICLCSVLLFGDVEAALLCYDCHGTKNTHDVRPEDSNFRNISTGGFQGNHRQHLGAGATASSCSKCHPGSSSYTSTHRDGRIKITGRINSSPLVTRYNNSTSAFPQTSTPSLSSCNSVNCHFEAATPVWGSSPASTGCGSCHGSPPLDGSHPSVAGSGKKHGDYFGTTGVGSCVKCHADNTTFAHATSVGRRPLKVQFSTGGSYTGDVSYPHYLPSQSPARNGTCVGVYCHSDGRNGAAFITPQWSGGAPIPCYGCHGGRTADSTQANCNSVLGVWSSATTKCIPDLTMSSNGHHRLVGPQWIRKYPCYYCHNNTADSSGAIKNYSSHVNGAKDISMASQWNIDGRPAPDYNPTTKVCGNVYCHSDGTTNPENVRPFAWTEPKTECNSCHGHPAGSCSSTNCHDGRTDGVTGKVWEVKTGWPAGSEWMGAMPMFPNQGAGTPRANSHPRHAQTNFTCDQCHAKTIKGDCISCHKDGVPPGGMGEIAHIDAAYHVNKIKNVDFKDMPSAIYDTNAKTCAGTSCHPVGNTPVWGGSVNSAQTCLTCHRTTDPDVDDFSAFNGTQGKINLSEWETRGHGRYSSAANTGSYPKSGNPAAGFPGNPCWYCHDNNVLHKNPANPFRLQMHNQYKQRFEKECVYCHMEGTNIECLSCHVGQTESLSPQATAGGVVFKFRNGSSVTKYSSTHTYLNNCINAGCHDSDSSRHKVNAGLWTADQKADVKNQYMMMGVCLQCHDDDSSNQCTSCHVAPVDKPLKYSLGFDPGTGFIKPRKARASAGHFGHKHYQDFKNSGGWMKHYTSAKSPIFGTYSVANGVWKGGKFCWDCHDPHGDGNIYMIQAKVATETDGIFGIPKKRSDVVFTDNASGTNYVIKSGAGVTVFNGICNVCHSPDSKHYTNNSGDGHNYSRRCTGCHEHRFADSHASKQSCDSCHTSSKPIPKHTAFGLPRDCTKCHSGTVGTRMDVTGQMKANSHHVQGVEVTSKHCYGCHWEATPQGLIDVQYHTGYNYKNYSSVKNDVVDLVIYGPGSRPAVYKNNSSAVQFRASNIGTVEERNELGKITNHCLSCHSDQNNDTMPFDDCKTPRQYAWDLQSVAARYSQAGAVTWGKYAGTTNAAKKNITKAFSAHGRAALNGGGFKQYSGLDGAIPNTRAGVANVQCYDCHNSHGSKVAGVTSSYVTFNGTNNGANLKETKKFIGGYSENYYASSNSTGVNPYGAGAGQCFDCHNSANAGTVVPSGKTPWGYNSTFGASAPIMGYKDTPKFGQATKASTARFAERDSRKTILGGHLKASEPPGSLPNLAKDTGTVSSGSTTSLTDGGKNWSPDDKWKNLYVLMVDGNNSGQVRKITASTATTLAFEPFAEDVASGNAYKIVPYSTTINGLCTPCHDPHGVSPTLGSNQAYAVPLLKGTYMTSPYKEDSPPPDPVGTNVMPAPPAVAKSWGKQKTYGGHPTPTQPVSKYNLDRTTFTGSTRISESDDKFAGLCMNCHKKENLTDGTNKNQNWKTVDRIHETVKGWGANTEHSFTCSKCHQPHVSGLPRLMQTNCLDYQHRGNKPSGGTYWSADSQTASAHGYNEHRGYPIASVLGTTGTPEATSSCHAGAPLNSGSWPDKNYWNSVTPWVSP